MQSEQGQPPATAPGLGGIFWALFRLGFTAFGGPAVIPRIRDLAVTRRGWVTPERFGLGLALCQLIPGATGMQLCAWLGLSLRGLPGAVAAFTGFAAPAFCLITLLSILYFGSHGLAPVAAMFLGFKAVVLAIVALAAVDCVVKLGQSRLDKVLAGLSALAFFLGISPVAVICAAGCLGAAIFAANPEGAACPPPQPIGLGLKTAAVPVLASLAGLALLAALDRGLFDLALTMAKVDLFAFGAFGAFPVMLHEVVTAKGWMNEQTFMDGIALGQATPGPFLLTSAFVGYHMRGLAGALVGAVYVFAPSFVLVTAAVPLCDTLLAGRRFRGALRGVQATLGGLIAATCAHLALATIWTPAVALLFVAALAALHRRIPAALVVVAGAAVSAALG